ncbi:MAG: carboxylate--amine ligase [Planctomycetes bacterium]|nr:carboxylate--amine ligase [Planctomycetota bacterium]
MMTTIKKPKERVISKYPKSYRVLAIVGDGPHGLSMVRNMGMNGLCVLSVCKTRYARSRHSRYSTGVWALDVPADQAEFIDEIEKLARQYDAGSIITLSEVNHLALIDNRDRFEPDICILSPAEKPFKKTLDKEYMRSLCEEIGVPVAKGVVLSEFLKDPQQDMSYPRIMRTRHKHEEDADRNAPWKVVYAFNEQEFNEQVEQVASIVDNVLVEECHPGVTYNISMLMHNGEPFFGGSYTGENHYPVAGGVTVQRITRAIGAPFEHAVNLLKALEYYEGNASVCFRYNLETDEFIFTEINPRFGGATTTITRAGFDIVFLVWQSHFEPDKMIKPHYSIGMRTRDFRGSVGWLRGILKGELVEPGGRQYSKLGAIASFLWHCGPWTYDDTLYWRDIKPYIMERVDMIVPHLPGFKKSRGRNQK